MPLLFLSPHASALPLSPCLCSPSIPMPLLFLPPHASTLPLYPCLYSSSLPMPLLFLSPNASTLPLSPCLCSPSLHKPLSPGLSLAMSLARSPPMLVWVNVFLSWWDRESPFLVRNSHVYCVGRRTTLAVGSSSGKEKRTCRLGAQTAFDCCSFAGHKIINTNTRTHTHSGRLSGDNTTRDTLANTLTCDRH